MKLVAYSVVPPNPVPYLHLGYIAGAVIQTYQTGWTLMVITWVVAIFCLKRFWGRSRRLALLSCLALVLVGFGWNILANKAARSPKSGVATLILGHAINSRLAEGKSVSTDIRELRRQLERSDDAFRDAWGHDLRISKGAQKDHPDYYIISAGRDGAFNTDDDIYTRLYFDRESTYSRYNVTHWKHGRADIKGKGSS